MGIFSKNSAYRLTTAVKAVFLFVAFFCCLFAFYGCSSKETSGASFTKQTSIKQTVFNESAAQSGNGVTIDTSSASDGYVTVSATAPAQLKLQMTCEGQTLNIGIPQTGEATVIPLSLGEGAYSFRVMQNTSGNNYVELFSTTADVSLESEFAPFLVPNLYCNYTDQSACTIKARELVKDAENQGEAVKAICSYIVENISYDDAKASTIKNSLNYTPSPDETLSKGSGICFDYASLGAAMLRSQGIPTKLVTGYVSPDNIYHSWIMVYIDGTWKDAHFEVSSNTWSRVDLTFAASSNNSNVGDGKSYTDRHVY